MSGCIYEDPKRKGSLCMAPIANYQVRMCQRHAALGRGLAHRQAPKKIPGVGRGTSLGATPLPPVELEIWESPPEIWRTSWCQTVKQGKPCRYGHTCTFAHSAEQLRGQNDPIPAVVYKPKAGAGDIAPPTPQPAAPVSPTFSGVLPAKAPEVQSLPNDERHQLANVPAADVPPEICYVCLDMYADRRWIPCGHMMCDKCMINWRQQTITKNVTGTACPVCRGIVSGSEVLPQAQQANGPRQTKVKTAWGNPEEKAANAAKFVGSMLTVEEERAQEALMRQRLRDEQQRQRRDAEEESHRQQEELVMREIAAFERAAAEKATYEKAAQQRVLQEKSARERTAHASEERAAQERHAKEAAERESLQQQVSAKAREANDRREQPQPTPSPSPPFSQLESLAITHFSMPYDQLSEYQRKNLERFTKKVTPPPGFEPAKMASQPPSILVAPSAVQAIAAPGTNVLAPAHSSTVNGGVNAGSVANYVETTKTSIGQESDDEDISEQERQKRNVRMAQRKARDEALAKAAQKQTQGSNGDMAIMSRQEYELARAEQRRLEQEREDLLLAQKLAEEERLSVTRSKAPEPVIPPKRTDGRWNCSLCTYENEPLHLVCAMCMIPRASQNQ